jgi:hypothetical protein
MFLICKGYLITLLKDTIGIPKVETTRSPNIGNREARVYSMPERGRIEFTLNNQERAVRIWDDWKDRAKIDPEDELEIGYPKRKKRIEVARQFITFVVELTAKTPELLNDDFNAFFRNLAQFVYDGQVANYIEETTGAQKTDTKGNKIKVTPGAYDFNDNKFYGDIVSRCFIEIEFEGGVYLVPDPVEGRVVFPAEFVTPIPAIIP